MEIQSCLEVKEASSQKQGPKPKIVHSNDPGLSEREKGGEPDLRGTTKRETVIDFESLREKTGHPRWKPRLPRG